MQFKTSRVCLQDCRQLILFSLLRGMWVRDGESSSVRERSVTDSVSPTSQDRVALTHTNNLMLCCAFSLNSLSLILLHLVLMLKNHEWILKENKQTQVSIPTSLTTLKTHSTQLELGEVRTWGLFVAPGGNLPAMPDQEKTTFYTCMRLVYCWPEVISRWHIQTDKRQVR